MKLFPFLKKKARLPVSVLPLKVDLHSHLLPGIDDGVQSLEESLGILREMAKLGYEKVITTPHTMPENFPNSPETILPKYELVKNAIVKEGIPIKLEVATEYYLDESFIRKLDEDEPLMTFGDRYVLFETDFLNAPPFLKEATFKMSVKGYKPVYAHPERYLYLLQDSGLLEEMIDREVYFQLNLVSLTGHYSKPVKRFAEKLIDRKVIRFVGTDCHSMRHIDLVREVTQTKYFEKLMDLELLNNSIL